MDALAWITTMALTVVIALMVLSKMAFNVILVPKIVFSAVTSRTVVSVRNTYFFLRTNAMMIALMAIITFRHQMQISLMSAFLVGWSALSVQDLQSMTAKNAMMDTI